MARRMEGKDENELVLDDKLDVARTITRLRARCETRRELNEIETKIKQEHRKEVDSGRVKRVVLPNPAGVLAGLGITTTDHGDDRVQSSLPRGGRDEAE